MFDWTVVRAEEKAELLEARAPADFLSAVEEQALARLAFFPRRQKWLLGRWAAKRLVLAKLAEQGSRVQPRALSVCNEPSGAPYAEVNGERLAWSLSLSHRQGLALAALCCAPGISLGADLELCEERDEVLVRDYFTEDEALLLPPAGRARQLAVARGWSLKESVLKALQEGLRVDPRTVEVGLGEPVPASWPDGFSPVAVRLRQPLLPAKALPACFRDEGGYVLSAAVLALP